MAVSNPIVDRIRIIPRPNDFLDRNVGSSGEVFYSKESNTLRLYGGDAAGGYEIVTENNLRRNIASQQVATVKYAVTIENQGDGNKYVLNGDYRPELTFVVGFTYVFDQSDSTNEFYPNAEGTVANPHPIHFSADDSEGSNGSGTVYTQGVLYLLDGEEVTAEEYASNAKFNRATQRSVQITIYADTPTTLYYYCTNHSAMGNTITVGMPGSGSGSATGGASVDVSDTAPVEPESGNIWFNSNTGQLFVYVTDADSSQWIQPATPSRAAFDSVTVGGVDPINASSGNTSFDFVAGSGISITSSPLSGTVTFSVDGQLGVDLTAFSVGADDPASGSGSLAYDNTTGVFTYTPPDLSSFAATLDIPTAVSELTNDSGFITSYTEVDTLATVTARSATTTENVTVANLTVTDITASGDISATGTITSAGAGIPTLTSASNLVLDAADAVVVQTGLFRLPSFTTTERNALTPANGDLIYNTTDNKFQGYENGAWANLI